MTRVQVLALSFALLSAAACESDKDTNSAGGDASVAVGNATEQAFLEGMVPHHESAIEMAEIARVRGESTFVKDMAEDIITAQMAEISELNAIHLRLFGEVLVPDPMAHEALGLTAEEAGMNHGPEHMVHLRAASPFDPVFVEMMIPHHRGAIRMAEIVLDATTDPELTVLAEGIITAQRREIMEMEGFLALRGGAPDATSPADAGASTDAGADADAGASADGGTSGDGGAAGDAGTSADANHSMHGG